MKVGDAHLTPGEGSGLKRDREFSILRQDPFWTTPDLGGQNTAYGKFHIIFVCLLLTPSLGSQNNNIITGFL